MFFVDDQFGDSKPVMAIPDRNRLAAIGLWTLSGCWSAKEMTDGRVGNSVLKRLGARPVLIDVLTNSDHALWVPGNGEIVFRDWPIWQETRDEKIKKRAKWAENKRGQRNQKGRYRTRDTSDENQLSTEDIPPDNTECPPETPPTPVPTPVPVPKPTVVTNGVGVTSVTANGAHTPTGEFCPNHPHGTTDNCGPCANIRKANQARKEAASESEAAGAQALADRRTALWAEVEHCPGCGPDSHGFIDTPHGAKRCPLHDWEAIHA